MAKIRNRQAVRAKLLALPEAIKESIRAPLEDGANSIVSLQKSLVPVNTGALKDSIGWAYGDVQSGLGGSKAAPDANGINDLKISIYAADKQTFYGRFIEFGTVKMRARPFFYPAYRALRKTISPKVARAVNAAIKKVASQ